MKLFFILLLLLWCLLDHDFICVISDGVSVSVMEGDSITLHTDVKIKQQEDIKWYFNGICISQISDVQSKNCTDDQCEDMGYGRFTNRLNMNCHTGSLTITSTSTTDSGVYKLKIFINSSDSEKTFIVTVHGSSGVVADEVSVMEGDSVTLQTGVQTNQQDRIRWYYKDIRIAQINRDQSKVCTDVQCNEGTERFRDRLKLDHQTGSLTITNISTEDSGEYQLQISSGSSDSEKIFIITLYDVSTAERDKMNKKSVKEGESVTLYTAVIRELNDYMAWYFNDVLIAEITGDQSQICTDDQCKERFRDRLKLDHQTGALTITHTRHTDSGEYKLQINSSRFSIIRSFSVSVTGVFGAYTGGVSVSVMEGDSVTLHTGVQTNQQDRIRWYYKDIRIAQINRDQSKVCTDVQCNEGTERFRDRLKLDHQTGSLTITNISTEDSGEYQLQISSGSSDSEKIFIITLYEPFVD
ncbi:carcinoembryonic antigen-related cell adhesion molecule 1-like isoform X2 [Pseudorasbora parva]|uniref:carcinoembryonic antigen-related cell adhesion molecule 1-like isoform X2 n=1 Tax=Pseudorasbora parva TaxID=51549 RepID=UPI00351E35A8